MARRYIGSVVIDIRYAGYTPKGDEYTGVVSVGEHRWKFDALFAPRVGFGEHSFDSPEAYDEMARAAVDFASYYTSHERGAYVPEWAPSPEIADAIEEGAIQALREDGSYDVKRKQ